MGRSEANVLLDGLQQSQCTTGWDAAKPMYYWKGHSEVNVIWDKTHGTQQRQCVMGWDAWNAAKPMYYGRGRREVKVLQDGTYGTQRRNALWERTHRIHGTQMPKAFVL